MNKHLIEDMQIANKYMKKLQQQWLLDKYKFKKY